MTAKDSGSISNPFLAQAHAVLPRVLALFDVDPLSPRRGLGDRFYWGWKLIDFANGTFQGACHGLCRLLEAGLLPDWIGERRVLQRTDEMFGAAALITRADGSLEEAFPYESSFCVTALAAFDLLSAVELLGPRIDAERRERWLAVVRPMLRFLNAADETHAFITNHLATAAAALVKGWKIAGFDGRAKAEKLLRRILGGQSPEGWLTEYEGADPGYQTLALYYLADAHRLDPELLPLEPLARAVKFLSFFAHPDGSLGGYYASRNTRFYYPAGVEFLAASVPEARALAAFMRRSAAERRVVTLDVMDEPNLIPMFNAVCWAAALCSRSAQEAAPSVPCLGPEVWRREFPGAGLLVDKGPRHYTVVSLHKGGVCYHFVDGALRFADTGAAARGADGKIFTTQAYRRENAVRHDSGSLTVEAPMTQTVGRCPTPPEFIVLRLLNVTLMRVPALRSLIKKLLVRLLITAKRESPVLNRRTIRLGPDCSVTDEWDEARARTAGLARIEVCAPFGAIHMASSGYWQRQDEVGRDSAL